MVSRPGVGLSSTQHLTFACLPRWHRREKSPVGAFISTADGIEHRPDSRCRRLQLFTLLGDERLDL